MITDDEVMRLFERADPARADDAAADADPPVYLTALRTRSSNVTLIDTEPTRTQPPNRHRWLIAAAAAVVAIIVGTLVLVTRDGTGEPEIPAATTVDPDAVVSRRGGRPRLSRRLCRQRRRPGAHLSCRRRDLVRVGIVRRVGGDGGVGGGVPSGDRLERGGEVQVEPSRLRTDTTMAPKPASSCAAVSTSTSSAPTPSGSARTARSPGISPFATERSVGGKSGAGDEPVLRRDVGTVRQLDQDRAPRRRPGHVPRLLPDWGQTTDEALRLWEQRTQEYVQAVLTGPETYATDVGAICATQAARLGELAVPAEGALDQVATWNTAAAAIMEQAHGELTALDKPPATDTMAYTSFYGRLARLVRIAAESAEAATAGDATRLAELDAEYLEVRQAMSSGPAGSGLEECLASLPR